MILAKIKPFLPEITLEYRHGYVTTAGRIINLVDLFLGAFTDKVCSCSDRVQKLDRRLNFFAQACIDFASLKLSLSDPIYL